MSENLFAFDNYRSDEDSGPNNEEQDKTNANTPNLVA
jgi:hypothetical protein